MAYFLGTFLSQLRPINKFWEKFEVNKKQWQAPITWAQLTGSQSNGGKWLRLKVNYQMVPVSTHNAASWGTTKKSGRQFWREDKKGRRLAHITTTTVWWAPCSGTKTAPQQKHLQIGVSEPEYDWYANRLTESYYGSHRAANEASESDIEILQIFWS